MKLAIRVALYLFIICSCTGVELLLSQNESDNVQSCTEVTLKVTFVQNESNNVQSCTEVILKVTFCSKMKELMFFPLQELVGL